MRPPLSEAFGRRAGNARGRFAGPRALELGPDRVTSRKTEPRSKKGLTRWCRRVDVREASLVEGHGARQNHLSAASGRAGGRGRGSDSLRRSGGISEGADIAMVSLGYGSKHALRGRAAL